MKAYFPKGFLKPEVFPFLIKNVLQPQPLKPQSWASLIPKVLYPQNKKAPIRFATPTARAAN